MAKQKVATVARKRTKAVFVVLFFLDGRVREVRVYSDALRAQRAFKRYVGYSDILKTVRAENRGISAKRAMLLSYAAIEHTRLAGTGVYQIEIDVNAPVRGRRSNVADAGSDKT